MRITQSACLQGLRTIYVLKTCVHSQPKWTWSWQIPDSSCALCTSPRHEQLLCSNWRFYLLNVEARLNSTAIQDMSVGSRNCRLRLCTLHCCKTCITHHAVNNKLFCKLWGHIYYSHVYTSCKAKHHTTKKCLCSHAVYTSWHVCVMRDCVNFLKSFRRTILVWCSDSLLI